MKISQTYPSLDELLRLLGLAGEHGRVECKESAWQLPKDLWETASAFANTDTLAASRALAHLEGLGLLCRSTRRRGPGVYYTLAAEREDTTAKGTPKGTPNTTPKTKAELLTLLSEGKRLAKADTPGQRHGDWEVTGTSEVPVTSEGSRLGCLVASASADATVRLWGMSK